MPKVTVLPKQSLLALQQHIETARALVTVDTGLAHLGASLGVPAVSIYGPTDPLLTGTLGQGQKHVQHDRHCVPCRQEHCRYQAQSRRSSVCMAAITPEQVWQELQLHCHSGAEACI